MTTLSQIQPALDLNVVVSEGIRSLVTVIAGGHEFAIDTEHINAVYQMARSQMGEEQSVVDTPDGKLPMLSLAAVLADEMGLPVENTDNERTLIVIHYGDQSAVLRVDSVSRPISLKQDSFFGLPRVAHTTDDRNLLSSIAVLDWKIEDPNEAIRLVVDPLAVLGFREAAEPERTQRGETAPIDLSKNDKSNVLGNNSLQGQILAFSPENVPRSDLDYVFCLPLAGVAEVVSVYNSMAMPFQSTIFQGFILWRKRPIPVVNLGEAFGQQSAFKPNQRVRDRARRLIIARASGGRYVGFYAQKQMHSMKTPSASTVEFESLKGTPNFGAFKTDFGTMVVPDLSRILDNR